MVVHVFDIHIGNLDAAVVLLTPLYIRTAALKEKARDYVASARLLGASTPRIIFN